MSRAVVLPAVVAAALATLVAAVQAPLWTYALSLALFGLPHVLTELRYVDERFAARLDRRTLRTLATLLAGIVALRLLGLAGVGPTALRTHGELLLGALLVAAVLPVLWRTRAAPLTAGALLALVAGFAFAPFDTFVALAVLHNLTPLGFLAERLRGRERRRALAVGAVVFGLVPALIATGMLGDAFGALPFTDDGPFGSGTLDLHLPVFVLPSLLGSAAAIDVFRAAVWLQCVHYTVVLHVLPRLSGGDQRAQAQLPWPHLRMRMVLVATGAAMTLAFVTGFAPARTLYGVAAALHAWLEIPILLLACAIAPVRTAALARAA